MEDPIEMTKKSLLENKTIITFILFLVLILEELLH